ncbi:condensin subunit, structural maintenance of chromosome protein 2, SMC2 [Guillardia theta CCMP2712]|uniref:Condensin subunit, structural maintenance of chromosome protein 2, SMC2 n=1 Tax=Guillardia theta (strain CCMP2712) TaxID=905079 RepID=L1J804_GUITC|nr:condensin subunit, structural maintenance of chromosome protein 2, SMC2 [Guillardia theta CCMP2712]EKX44205.1 condensin subunit, structural maintenance of chromosome protein 2, SMC2 [Guillardia theta CCMP2712]|eukprot:XP_005831185.1 condensin subunit, structural maintenance of chromosome protein 2, SMC2 [Guillardia theta CCMP2712]
MHIQEIIIDGFKSYAKRTVIQGFDPMFNAITGLNGSGKSNILDSICFVLGISRLEQVRAGSLQELVYKQGQAGVTKATVTIVFDNKDKKGSPVGYESYDEIAVCRQVAIGGRNKYLINGHVAQQNKVQNLFHSVQLNINNPHFLIMQGRITKVINMSPQEILGLIAEAAGTKMYESKKEAALKTIEKKETKLEEIQRILKEDITPTLEKLRTERAAYIQWTSGNTERERLERFCTAWEFTQAENLTRKAADEMLQMEADKKDMEKKCKDLSAEIAEKEEIVKSLQRAKANEMGGEMKELEAKSNELSKALVKATTTWQHSKENLDSEKKAVDKTRKQHKDLQKVLDSNKAKVSKAEKSVQDITEQVAGCQGKLTDLQRQKQGLQAGCDADSKEGEKSLADQLKDAKTHLSQRQKGAKNAGKEYEQLQHLLESKGGSDCFSQDELKAQISLEEAAVRKLQEEVDALSAQISNFDVQYTSPSSSFDRSKVKGIVASLVKLKDKSTATAIEVAAGAKLYQLVVKDEETGKQILKNGQLKKRVTIIPLNKIQASTVPDSILKTASKSLGPERARLALEFVGYDDEVEAAMKYVLGKTMVCKDVEAAKSCAFNEGIRVKSVTLEGDLFDPAGTLTGGTRAPTSSSILTRFGQPTRSPWVALTLGAGDLLDKKEELEQREKKLKALKAQVKAPCEAMSSDVSMASQPLDHSHQAAEELRSMEEEVNAGDQKIAEKTKEKEEASALVKRLEKQIQEYSKSWDKLLAAKEKEIAETKELLTQLNAKLKATREENESILLDSQASAEELKTIEEQIAAGEEVVAKCEEEVAALEQTVTAKRSAFDEAEAELKERRDAIKQADKDIQEASKECEKTEKKLEEQKIAIKKLEHQIARFDKDSLEAKKAVEHFLRVHSWISTERAQFGKAGGDYDFKANDPKKAQERMKELVEQHEKLGKKINKKVMGMFEKAEQEYQEVMEKKRIVENDKRKIEMVMEELDEKKNQALKTTWTKVNRDFSSIFQTLLPNARAKLEPPEGGSVLDGLVLRVGFGDCWKESLSELSGGQRSLLALSLILALLLFKPAPMYILDEIDAALDLSHTQNIGHMLKTHFKNSQFIIVSLKEGMFNNANVLFRTKFVDGVSTVTRTTPGQKA